MDDLYEWKQELLKYFFEMQKIKRRSAEMKRRKDLLKRRFIIASSEPF